MRHAPPTVVGSICVAVVLVCGVGCGSDFPVLPYARAYPSEVTQGRVLDVQVFRHGLTIEFTNTAAADIGACTMWLNGRFSRPFDGVRAGQSVTLPLREFVDEFSEPFRAGGLLSTEAPDRLVLAQLEFAHDSATPGFVGLVVVGGVDE